ncbi:MAG: VCBS repeat-containing protein, partial [Nocardioidaceae bacterium]|nr:VCBS repeat-containing protein [Nocardioidaceae bacterium]
GAPKKKSRAWIWVTVAVVLMVGIGAAVTLVVLQPWSDDSSSKKADEEKDSPEKAVQSDIDGDGRGDAVYRIRYDYDNVKQVTALSDGEKFETSETAVDADSKSQQMYLDWDGDGVNEDLTTNVIGSASQLTLSSADDDWPEDQTFTFSFSSLREYGDPDMRVTHGDFDGDGNEDLAVAGQNKKKVDIYVLAGDGKGTFADPSPWVSVPNAVIDVMSFYPGDFDKDGDADLWVELPSGRLDAKAYKTGYYGDRGYELLTSDGKSFTPGAVVKAPGYYNLLLVGDVTGDGTDSIVGVDSDSYNKSVTITVFDVSGGQMTTVTGFAGSSKIGKRTVQSAQLSDVDGDGKADIVFAAKDYEEKAFTGLQVMRSTGAVFESASVWAEIPVCPDDSCRLEFEGAADRY